MTLLKAAGLVLLVGIVFVLPALGLVDANRRPDWAWTRAGENKRTWMILMACAFVFFIPIASLVGVGASGMYWAGRRKKILAAESAGMLAQSSQGPTPGWYADPNGQAPLRWWDGSAWTPHIAG